MYRMYCQDLCYRQILSTSTLSGKLAPDIFNRICPIFVLSRSTSCVLAVVHPCRQCHECMDEQDAYMEVIGRVESGTETEKTYGTVFRVTIYMEVGTKSG